MSFGSARAQTPKASTSAPQDNFAKLQAAVDSTKASLKEINDKLILQFDGDNITDRIPFMDSKLDEAKTTARTFDKAIRALTKEAEESDVRQRQMVRYRLDKMKAMAKATKDDVNKTARKLHEAKLGAANRPERDVQGISELQGFTDLAPSSPVNQMDTDDPELSIPPPMNSGAPLGDDYSSPGIGQHGQQEQLERYSGMEHIHGQVAEVNAIFKDLATIVTAQGETIATVEENTDKAAENAAAGTREIEKLSQKYGITNSVIVVVILTICLIGGIYYTNSAPHAVQLTQRPTVATTVAAVATPEVSALRTGAASSSGSPVAAAPAAATHAAAPVAATQAAASATPASNSKAASQGGSDMRRKAEGLASKVVPPSAKSPPPAAGKASAPAAGLSSTVAAAPGKLGVGGAVHSKEVPAPASAVATPKASLIESSLTEQKDLRRVTLDSRGKSATS